VGPSALDRHLARVLRARAILHARIASPATTDCCCHKLLTAINGRLEEIAQIQRHLTERSNSATTAADT
jgi:hypothetical protein